MTSGVIYGLNGEVLKTAAAAQPFEHDPENPTQDDWGRYADWRKTKCRPPDPADSGGITDDYLQATLEFVGELGELAEVFLDEDTGLLSKAESQARLTDEVGDVFFCGSWLLDTLGSPYLRDVPTFPSEPFGPPELLERSQGIAAQVAAPPLSEERISAVMFELCGVIHGMLIRGTKLCNTAKKRVYQERPQNLEALAANVMLALASAAHILQAVGLRLSDALTRNIAKLDARYPHGYQGAGGGIREGKGR